MVAPFNYGSFRFQLVETEREINFIVEDFEGYLGRLVPGYEGFVLSPLDIALGNFRGLPYIARLSDYIVRRYA